ncbi:MAG: TetR/AcrR family transcriptional regulator [Alphaproteobacteria bacterium]|nr:TetR/AcrR family transcriptional regulator [Alphaproteobacteria bacterium]
MPQHDSAMPTHVSAKEAKRIALLDAAAAEFNARGISGASLSRIARAIGIGRAALYYYVKDRDDLAAQCYRKSCEIMARDLHAATQAVGTGFDRVLAFLRLSLDPGRAQPAVLSEVAYLQSATQRAIASAQRANVEALRSLIRKGMKDGSIRACDDEIIAQTLIGTINWIPVSIDWVDGTGADFRIRTVEALCDLVTYGEARDRNYRFVPTLRIESFFPAPAKAFDRHAMAEAKIEQLLMTASQLFNRRGIDGVSLEDITNELGATKGVFYHYLNNKTELVARCYKRAFSLYQRFVEAAAGHGESALDRSMCGLYLNIQAHTSGLSPLIQMVGVTALAPAVKRDITQRARALQRRFEEFGRQGLKDRSFRKLDFDALAQLGAGAFEWLPKWFSLDDPRAEHALADEIVAFFAHGLKTD